MPVGIRRRILTVATLLLAAVASGCSDPPLIANLPTNIAAARVEFERRVGDRFPVGSSAAEAEHELVSEGFAPEAPPSGGSYTHVYWLHKSGLVCRNDWHVAWRADEAGRLTAIKGTDFVTCL